MAMHGWVLKCGENICDHPPLLHTHNRQYSLYWYEIMVIFPLFIDIVIANSFLNLPLRG